MFSSIRRLFLRSRYREGKTLSRFIAKDIRREIQIVSAARIEDGFVTCRVRTTNLLYVFSGLASLAEFGPSEEVRVKDLWRWTGASWGGLPDGTSLAVKLWSKAQHDASAKESPN